MAEIESDAVDPFDPLATETISEPVKTQVQHGDHRKSFVSRVDFRIYPDSPVEAKDLALSKTNFFWLRLNANKFYGKRNKALDRCVPRDLTLCLGQYDSTTPDHCYGPRAPTDAETGRPKTTKTTGRFLRLGRYDPFEARGSYEILQTPEVRCSSIVEEVERKPSFPQHLTTSDFKAALRKCLVAAYVRDRWDGLNVKEALEKFNRDHVEKLRAVQKEKTPCTGRRQPRQPSSTPGASAGVQSPADTSSTDGIRLPQLPTGSLALCAPGKQSDWKVRYWDTAVLDRMIMSGSNK